MAELLMARSQKVAAFLTLLLLAVCGSLLAAKAAHAEKRECGDVARKGHTAYTITTNGTCQHAREVVARYIRATHAGSAAEIRHARLDHLCSWKLRKCSYQGGDRVIRWKWTVPYSTGLASWYDGGGTASGRSYTYGFASLFLAHGTRVEFCYHGCQVGVNDDRGPYVAGRLFDLRPNLKNAIGCGDLCWLRWRIVNRE